MLKNAEKIIVAADGCYSDMVELAYALQGTGVVFKVNWLLRERGYDFITLLKKLNLRVFADLKLNDIPVTMEKDALSLREYTPDFVTVMASAGEEGIRRVVQNLPDTTVLAVTVLTSVNESVCRAVYGG